MIVEQRNAYDQKQRFHIGPRIEQKGVQVLLLIILIVLAIIFLAGGFSTRGHSTYGTYSTPGMGLGGLLILIVLVLYLTGNLQF